jgi:hypothetical protein
MSVCPSNTRSKQCKNINGNKGGIGERQMAFRIVDRAAKDEGEG